ncbi:MAG: hypothetical protein H6661_02340 [Ardenticatenaceae bacterium]|nr:hypothetical protein [Ardenticatenaceae bacterium]
MDSVGVGENAPGRPFRQPALFPNGAAAWNDCQWFLGQCTVERVTTPPTLAAIVPNRKTAAAKMTPLPAERLGITLNIGNCRTRRQVASITVENMAASEAEQYRGQHCPRSGPDLLQLRKMLPRMTGNQWTAGNLSTAKTAQGGICFPGLHLSTCLSGGYYTVFDGLPRTAAGAAAIYVRGAISHRCSARALSRQHGDHRRHGHHTGILRGQHRHKFYMEDETGGIQVYVPDGMDLVSINVVDKVRVTKGVEVYRNSLECAHGVPAGKSW